MPEVLLRPEEAATALNLGRTTVYTLMRKGEIRSVKISKNRRIPSSAIQEYVARLIAEQCPVEAK